MEARAYRAQMRAARKLAAEGMPLPSPLPSLFLTPKKRSDETAPDMTAAAMFPVKRLCVTNAAAIELEATTAVKDHDAKVSMVSMDLLFSQLTCFCSCCYSWCLMHACMWRSEMPQRYQ